MRGNLNEIRLELGLIAIPPTRAGSRSGSREDLGQDLDQGVPQTHTVNLVSVITCFNIYLTCIISS